MVDSGGPNGDARVLMFCSLGGPCRILSGDSCKAELLADSDPMCREARDGGDGVRTRPCWPVRGSRGSKAEASCRGSSSIERKPWSKYELQPSYTTEASTSFYIPNEHLQLVSRQTAQKGHYYPSDLHVNRQQGYRFEKAKL